MNPVKILIAKQLPWKITRYDSDKISILTVVPVNDWNSSWWFFEQIKFKVLKNFLTDEKLTSRVVKNMLKFCYTCAQMYFQDLLSHVAKIRL